ncbi:hypothetical protein D9611_009186 [Ephemerocybe angulata]|uniref:Mediator of RNA polymerase II transcription subunit 8 n=1 Tax=Ephemerocybe angulata TaxID=980116 RepID=A0A8H5FK88_9AGAR|nr:hypothetical protein D9611_009186 [Tulosesus angulatus]
MNPMQNAPVPPELQKLPTPVLPVSQLESLRFKTHQIIDSIHGLMGMIAGNPMHPAYMPSWPELLSKFNVILSQTTTLSNALVTPFPTTSSATGRAQGNQNAENIFQKIVLHPNVGITDQTMDTEIGPLLRNQQTTEVLKRENETVRHLSEHMSTRGMLGVLGISNTTGDAPVNGARGIHLPPPRKPEYEDVIQECNEIRSAHDSLVDRATRAVALLRDKYEWKKRVEVEDEPEDLKWDLSGPQSGVDEDIGMDSGDEDDSGDDKADGSSDVDEANVEELMDNKDDMDDVRTPGSVDLFGGVEGNDESVDATDPASMQGIS